MFIPSRQTVVSSLVSFFCICGVTILQFQRMQTFGDNKQSVSVAALKKDLQLEQANLKILKQAPTFGFDNVIANWAYLGFAQYFGDEEARSKTGYSLSPEYFEVILKHDPRFVIAYLALSTSTSMYAGLPENSVNLTKQGLKHLSPWDPKNSFYVWRYKAIDELLFLGDSKSAKNSFKSAADWAKKHPDKESQESAYISERTSNFLSKNPQSKAAQISAWVMVLQNGVDPETQKRAIKAIERLGGTVMRTAEGQNQIKFPQKDS
uniref:hypothetical protein n=1 Tax=Calothrix sp. PCC 6303 TaxID=1170562 RepID=UPI001939635B|nr:hypothetical protein [Calothrix sp. PCC 6303]